MNRSYLTDRGNDITQRVQRGRQRADHKIDPHLDGALVFRLLPVIKDKERQLRILQHTLLFRVSMCVCLVFMLGNASEC
jgi:hypothetical protein